MTQTPAAKSKSSSKAAKIKFFTLLGSVIVLVILFEFTPLKDKITLDALTEFGERIWNLPFGPVLITLLMGIALTFMFPVNILSLAAVTILDPIPAIISTFFSAMIASSAGFYGGRYLGKEQLERYFGQKLQKLQQHKLLKKKGFLAIAILRNIPLAPFTAFNLFMGAVGIRARDFFIGTALGLLPGKLVLVFFAESLKNFARQRGEDGTHIPWMAIVFLLLLLAGAFVVKKYGNSSAPEDPGSTNKERLP